MAVGIAENKAVVRRVFDLVEAHDYDAVDDLVADDFVNHAGGGAQGVEPWKKIFRALAEDFPDAHYTVDDVIAEGDKVVVVATMRGTHTASTMPPLREIPPRGITVEWGFIHIFRVAKGRLSEHWARRNDLEVVRVLTDG